MVKKIVTFIIFILVGIASYLLINTLNFKSKQISYPTVEKIEISDSAIHRLASAIRIKTISNENPAEFDSAQFNLFRTFISESYPLVNQTLTKKTINTYSYIYKWEGNNSQLKPVVLTGHTDVVPVPDSDVDQWKAAPFGGEIKENVLWGRGTMDDKIGVLGILEAVEHLLSQGFTPERTIYLAFGHDEEIGGRHGAKEIAAYMKKQGINPEFVLDEGFTMVRGLIPGVLTDVALIGTAEKGFTSITLSTEIKGGHSSMPNKETAISVLTNAITKLQNDPFPLTISPPVQQFMDYIGPEMRFQEKLVFANSGLFESIILGIYNQNGPSRAVVQTTMAPTIFQSGIKENIIPASASATINFRILPGTSIESVVNRVKQIMDDERIELKLSNFQSEPSKVSSTSTAGFSIINQSIKEIYPYVTTAPNLVIAATDGRYYEAICDNIYRFLPIHLNPDNVSAMHGINENIPIQDFEDAIRFYMQLIKNCD